MSSAKILGRLALGLSLVSTIFGMLAFKKGEEEAERRVVEQKNINSDFEKR